MTNDTLAPLRSLISQSGGESRESSGAATKRGRRAFRSRRRARLPGSDGRWSLLSRFHGGVTPTERLAALAGQLVERHGVLTRDQIAREQVEGGFSAVYPILKAMEESGKIRRGYFVDGQGGAQFAAAGADELLRARSREDEPPTNLLAATDPASAYGVALPWPEMLSDDAGKPQRAAGCRVVISDGQALAYLNKTSQSLTTFLTDTEPERSQQANRLAKALAKRAKTKRSILLTKIDGGSAIASPLASVLTAHGFTATTRGLLCRSDFMAGSPKPRRPSR